MSSQFQPETQTRTHTQENTTSPDDPPSYDTLSLAPPSINEPQPKKESLRQKFVALKAEDERRKAERITHVSAEEADRITGLDQHRVEEERKSAERKRGGRSILGIVMLN